MTKRILGHFLQQPNDVLQYEIDWSEWLAVGETISTATIVTAEVTTPPLVIGTPFLAGSGVVQFFISGGLNATEYKLTNRITTSAGQAVEREFFVSVEEL